MKIYDLNKSLETNLINRKNKLDKDLPLTRSLARHPLVSDSKEIKLEISAEARQLGLAFAKSKTIETVLSLLSRVEHQIDQVYQDLSKMLAEVIQRFWGLDARATDQTTVNHYSNLIEELVKTEQLILEQIGEIFDFPVENLKPEQLQELVQQLQNEQQVLEIFREQIGQIFPTAIEGHVLVEIMKMYPTLELQEIAAGELDIEKLLAIVQRGRYLKHLSLENFSKRLLLGESPPNFAMKSDLLYLILVLVSVLQHIYQQRLRLRIYRRLPTKVVQGASSVSDDNQEQTQSNSQQEQMNQLIEFVAELFLYQALNEDSFSSETLSQELLAYLDLLLQEDQLQTENLEEYIYIGFLQAAEQFGAALPQLCYYSLEMLVSSLSKHY